MARDAESLKIGNTPWADTGDRTDPDNTTLIPPLDRGDGWPSSFSGPGGNTLRRRVVNQIFREIYGMLIEINRHGGILEWDATINYQHDPAALVFGSDGTVYVSVQDSLNQDPTLDTGNVNWRPFIEGITGVSVRNLLQGLSGNSRLATSALRRIEVTNEAAYDALSSPSNDIDYWWEE